MLFIDNYRPKHIQRPYFLSEDKTKTMQRYRVFKTNYNAKVPVLNKEVKAYNKRVSEFIKAYNLEQQALVAQNNFKTQKTGDIQNKWLSTTQFNERVEKVNGQMLLLKKKKHIEIKQPQEETFEAVLLFYSHQLIKLRKQLQSLNSDAKLSFPKVQTTSTRICNFKHEGVVRLDYCKDTIQSHIHRLRMAGVLTDYVFKGTKKPVEYFINSSIFCFRDNQKSLAENQLVTDFIEEKLSHNSVDTRTSTKEIIKKVGNVDNHSRKAEVDSFADGKNKNTYKNTTKDDHHKISKQNEGKLGRGENFPKNHLSEYLRSKIQYRSKLLQDLTAHHYDNYSYSAAKMKARLQVEATNGAMAREEFRELLLQVFLKIAAPIWKAKDVYYGSWHKAMVQIDDEYLRNPNGSIPRKETLLYMFGYLIYRITRAKRFFKSKKEYRIHYPCIYFDPTRKLPSEGGFAYTLKWLKDYQKYKERRATRKQQAATKAGARRRQKTNEEKVRDKLKLYIKGKITLPMVFSYIEHNKGIPDYFATEVPRLLQLLTNKEFDLYE